MEPIDVEELCRKGISLLRFSAREWSDIAETRSQGRRFSLNFPHALAKRGKRGGLVLIANLGSEGSLQIGLISSIGATSTLDSRVVFDLVRSIRPSSLTILLSAITASGLRAPRDRLASGKRDFERVSPKLGKALIEQIASDPENEPALIRILARLRLPTRYNNARALQQDAVKLAIKAFGGSEEASSIALPGGDTAIANVRILEDAAIEHDARWIPGWHLAESDLTGRATFLKKGERLDVFTANKRPLEKLFGVDLIYLNEARGAFVMVQYKMLEPQEQKESTEKAGRSTDAESDEQGWIVRINGQFKDEMSRMRQFDQDLDPEGPYRLNSGPFFFKFVRREASADSAGILLSLEHLDQLISEGNLAGPRGGLSISYSGLDGHYLRSGPFVELVRSGYVGTRGSTTEHLQTLVEEALMGGRAVVVGIQTALTSVALDAKSPKNRA